MGRHQRAVGVQLREAGSAHALSLHAHICLLKYSNVAITHFRFASVHVGRVFGGSTVTVITFVMQSVYLPMISADFFASSPSGF